MSGNRQGWRNRGAGGLCCQRCSGHTSLELVTIDGKPVMMCEQCAEWQRAREANHVRGTHYVRDQET